MSKYSAAYRCPLCQTLIVSEKSTDIPEHQLPELLGKFIRNQSFINNPYLYEAPMHTPHKCDNGDAGLAYFAGFKKV